MNKLFILFRASRPVFWPLFGVLFSIGAIAGNAEFTAGILANLFLVSSLLPLVVFGINDVFDYETDSRNKRKKAFISGGVLPKSEHRFVIASAIAASAAMLLFSYFTHETNFFATVFALFIAWGYSFKGIRLKEIPIIDSLSNAALIWAVILIGFSHGGILAGFPLSIYFASLGAAAAHALSAVVDYESDKKANVRTIATFFGRQFAAAFAGVLALLIILYSGIQSMPLRIILYYALAASAAIGIRPSLAKRLTVAGFVIAMAMMILFSYQQFYI